MWPGSLDGKALAKQGRAIFPYAFAKERLSSDADAIMWRRSPKGKLWRNKGAPFFLTPCAQPLSALRLGFLLFLLEDVDILLGAHVLEDLRPHGHAHFA
jgi:hypothetical protein